MDVVPQTLAPGEAPDKPAWNAVFALSLGVFGLVTAEFLPASLLTPMAQSLKVSEGLTGQAVTVTALVALFAGLLIPSMTRKVDRRYVLLAFSVLLIISNLLVVIAPDLQVLLAARVLLGVAIGGFWTMSAATAMRLVPPDKVPRALSMIFAGVSAATIAAAPLGSYFGDLIGWRNVFLLATALGVLSFVWQLAALPRMAPASAARLGTMVEILRRPGVAMGMLACLMVFAGHFAFFTYLRPFLEGVTGVGVTGVSVILLGFGVANFVGTSLAGFFLERNLRATLLLMPLLMGTIGAVLATVGGAAITDAVLVAIWGMAFGAVPVAWSTWLTKVVPDEAESGGGLIVAAVQFAIAAGAAVGGVVFDATGARGVFLGSAIVLLVAALCVFTTVRMRVTVAAQCA